MTVSNNIRGLGVALVTPFTNDGKIDVSALRLIVDYVVSNGADFVVALGTTGETPTLDDAEREKVVKVVAETVNGRVPLVVGAGGYCTGQVCRHIANLSSVGADAILSVAPYYNKPSQEGLFQHFCAVSNTSPLPVILYNVPSRTGVNINSNTTIRIAEECKNVVAIKESSGDMVQVAEILRGAPQGFSVLSGDDINTFSVMSMGGKGVISVVGNALPRMMAGLVGYLNDGQTKEAAQQHLKLLDMFRLVFREGNPPGIKALMEIMGMCSSNVRLPLTKISDQLYDQLKTELDRIENHQKS